MVDLFFFNSESNRPGSTNGGLPNTTAFQYKALAKDLAAYPRPLSLILFCLKHVKYKDKYKYKHKYKCRYK